MNILTAVVALLVLTIDVTWAQRSKWDGPFQLPLVAASGYNLPNGQVLLWAGNVNNDFSGGGQTVTATFDPTTGASSQALIQNTNHDMFCPGTAQLGDGRVMVTGGYDSGATSIYDPVSNSWSIGARMVQARGYHAMTVLTDGSVFTIGGSWSGGIGGKFGEVWNATTKVWTRKANLAPDTLVTNDVGGLYRADNHMWLWVAPNGKVFHAGPSRQMHWIDVTGDGSIVNSIARGDDVDAMCGNTVMYDVGKILKLGGATSYDNGVSASVSAYVIDVNGAEATVQRVGNMALKRTFSNSVVLPSGEVVVIGGLATANVFSDQGAVLPAEIWSPITNSFSTLSSMRVPRTYHSVALLLKDGRVMSAGGGLCGGCTVNHFDAEILTPPYLLNADGSSATRPVILNAPTTVIPGTTFSVTVDTTPSHSFALVRFSGTTHSVNNDQRRIPLAVLQSNNGVFNLLVPSNPHVVPPGFYFLFAMNANGVPSIARIVSVPVVAPSPITPRPTPPPTRNPTSGPTRLPTPLPTTPRPTTQPTPIPTSPPTTLRPTTQPVAATPIPTPPIVVPTTLRPTLAPTRLPTVAPTRLPTLAPQPKPTVPPTSPPVAPPPTRIPTAPPTTCVSTWGDCSSRSCCPGTSCRSFFFWKRCF